MTSLLQLSTERLLLEPLEKVHADMLFTPLSDPALYEFTDDEPPKDLPSLQQRYQRLSLRISPDGNNHWLNWAIRVRTESRFIGYVQATIAMDHTTQIGYMLAKDSWGNGFAKEAVSGMIIYLESAWGVNCFSAQVNINNVRSISLLKSLNFQLSPSFHDGDIHFIKVSNPKQHDWLYGL